MSSTLPPNWATALFATRISSSLSTAFMARNRPPTLTSGSVSSHSTFNAATAREVAISYCSRCFAANSSARAWTQVTRCRPISSQTCCRKAMRLPRLSSSVKSKSGSKIRRGIPGKPAPVPTSTTRLPRKSVMFSSAAQSSRCSLATSSGSVMAVRFITLLVSSNCAENAISGTAASVGRERAARPSRRICSIMYSALSADRGSRSAAPRWWAQPAARQRARPLSSCAACSCP